MRTNRIPHLLALLFVLALLGAACGDDTDTDVGDDTDDTSDDADDAVGDDGTDSDDGTRPGVAGEWLLVSLTVDGSGPPLSQDGTSMKSRAIRVSTADP